MGNSTTNEAKELVKPILDDLELELVDIEFVKEGKNWYLRVYIDSDHGVDLDACTEVSEKLSQRLDETDLISHPYFLEVSSPGAERPLKKDKDFRDAIGKSVRINTYAAIDGEKEFEGELIDFDGEQLQMNIKKKTKQIQVAIPYDKVASARLAVVFQ